MTVCVKICPIHQVLAICADLPPLDMDITSENEINSSKLDITSEHEIIKRTVYVCVQVSMEVYTLYARYVIVHT